MKLSLNDIQLRNDDRMVITGHTGCGKSFFAQYVLPRIGNLAIIDPKRMFDFPNVPIFDTVAKILRSKPKRFIYRPNEKEVDNLDAYNAIYRYCYDMGNITVYTDDLVGVLKANTYPRYLQLCYTMGRAKLIRLIASVQRPKFVPLFVYTESTKHVAFRTLLETDSKRLNEIIPGYSEKMPKERYQFTFFDIHSGKPPFTTSLEVKK